MLSGLVVVILVCFFHEGEINSSHSRIAMGTFCVSHVFLFHAAFGAARYCNTTSDRIRPYSYSFPLEMDSGAIARGRDIIVDLCSGDGRKFIAGKDFFRLESQFFHYFDSQLDFRSCCGVYFRQQKSNFCELVHRTNDPIGYREVAESKQCTVCAAVYSMHTITSLQTPRDFSHCIHQFDCVQSVVAFLVLTTGKFRIVQFSYKLIPRSVPETDSFER